MGTKKPPFWGTKTTLPPPDRPQESVDVTRIPAPGAKMPGSSQRLLPSNDPGGVSCPSTAAWYRWDFPIPRIRTFSRPDQKLLYQTGRKMQEQYRPRRKKCMFSSRVLRRKRINGICGESHGLEQHCHSEPVRLTGVGISIEFQAAYRHTVCSIRFPVFIHEK